MQPLVELGVAFVVGFDLNEPFDAFGATGVAAECHKRKLRAWERACPIQVEYQRQAPVWGVVIDFVSQDAVHCVMVGFVAALGIAAEGAVAAVGAVNRWKKD